MKNIQLLNITLFLAIAVAAPTRVAASNTAELWLDKCARCHGDTGSGDTPLGRKLKITDYSSKKAQEAFTDEHIQKLITEGKVANGKTVMPAYKDEISAEDTKALTKYIRSLAK